MLLDIAALEKSEVVANGRMNRQRNLAGANSYEKDLGLNPLQLLKNLLKTQQQVAWLDLCCGTGRALIQAAELCHAAGLGYKIKLTGVDLVPMFDSIGPGIDCVHLIAASLEEWETVERFDLVTCVHGLHYIGDKLGLLQRASNWLRDGGRLMVHLDYRNLRINDRTSFHSQMGKDLSQAGFRFASRRHLLFFSAQTSSHKLPYRYLGSDDQAGPNYTGQEAVDSYYERLRS